MLVKLTKLQKKLMRYLVKVIIHKMWNKKTHKTFIIHEKERKKNQYINYN